VKTLKHGALLVFSIIKNTLKKGESIEINNSQRATSQQSVIDKLSELVMLVSHELPSTTL